MSSKTIEEVIKEFCEEHWIGGLCPEHIIAFTKSDAAKEYWFEQFKAQEKPVWVKASERLPKHSMTVYYKYNSNKLLGIYDNGVFITSDVNKFDKDDYEKIEWLDESAMQPQLTEQEIETMAEKEYPIEMCQIDEFGSGADINEHMRKIFIKGFKAALQTK